MNSNTHSIPPSTGRPDGLAALSAAVDELAAQDLDRLPDTVVAERVLRLRRLVDRLEGQWLKALAAVDARGAAGAEDGVETGSTAAWLRGRLRLGADAASGAVRTARALFRGPLAATAQALTDGDITAAHARVLAQGTKDLPQHVAAEAEPVPLEAAGRLDPPRLRRVLGHLQLVADPDGAKHDNDRRHQRRGLWLAPTFEGMVALDGLLEAEAGQTLLAALEPWPARPTPATPAAAASAALMPWLSWPAAVSKPGGCPRPVGSAPASGDGGPGQPARPPRHPRRRGRLGRTAGPRGGPAAGL
jgi:uncharacterized protein DUF222